MAGGPDSMLDIQQDREEKQDPNVFLFVSLYLIVFAFFVVLNAISSKNENQVAAVLGSVSATFQPTRQPNSPFVDILTQSDKVVGNDAYLDRTYQMFQSLVNIPGFKASRDGNLLRISLPANHLFYEYSSMVRDEVAGLLDNISAEMALSPPGMRNEIQFSLGAGAGLPEAGDLANNLQVMRAGSFAAELYGRGTAADAIVTGVERGDPAVIELTFGTRREARDRRRQPNGDIR